MRQVSARNALAAVLTPLILGASVTGSAVHAREQLPQAWDAVESALSEADDVGRCLLAAQLALFPSASSTATTSSMQAAQAQLTRCDLRGFATTVASLDLPRATPLQPRRTARARSQLAESIRLLEQCDADARTVARAASAKRVDEQFVLIAYRSFTTARLRADQYYAEAAADPMPS